MSVEQVERTKPFLRFITYIGDLDCAVEGGIYVWMYERPGHPPEQVRVPRDWFWRNGIGDSMTFRWIPEILETYP